jgi:hypothetical protein
VKLHLIRGVQQYPIEHGHKVDHLHLETDLLLYFPDDRFLNCLA